MEPIKIYLDQKDYSRIGWGLLGHSQYAKDVDVYHFLMDLVNHGKIRIYFSCCHAIEALRYDEQKIDLLKPYCEAIDSLTQGHCIKWPKKLEKIELEIFLGQQFGFKAAIRDDSPYGKSMAAFPFSDNFFSLAGRNIKERIKESFQNQSIPQFQRRELVKLINNKKKFKKMLSGFPPEKLGKLSARFPGFDLTKEEFIEICCGNESIGKKVLERFFSNVVKFKNLVLNYSKSFPEVKQMGRFFDSTSDKLSGILISQQIMQEAFPRLNSKIKNADAMFGDWAEKYIESLITKEICKIHKVDVKEVKERLINSELKELPSVNSYITFGLEYFKKHKGGFSRGRKPKQSDLMDIFHIRNLPYVDVYSTDKFFAEVARRKSNEFRTRVVTSLSQLKSTLESEFKIDVC